MELNSGKSSYILQLAIFFGTRPILFTRPKFVIHVAKVNNFVAQRAYRARIIAACELGWLIYIFIKHCLLIG